jgi:malonyl-CoA O-methyltransferase
MEAYALWAESYEQSCNPLLILEERIVTPLLPPLGGKIVLDFGCGTGRWLHGLSDRGTLLRTGVDLSPEMLRQAVRKPSLAGLLVRGDSAELPVKDTSIDFAICSFAASYVDDLRRLASEAARVTKPGASLILSDFHPEAVLHGWTRTFRHGEDVIEVESLNRPVDLVCQTFASHGFELTKLFEPYFSEPERSLFRHSGKEDLFEDACRVAAIFVCCFRRVGNRTP